MRYIAVFRKLGGYDTCLDHAERLQQADRNGYAPEAWPEKIRRIDRDAAADAGIPGLEGRYARVR